MTSKGIGVFGIVLILLLGCSKDESVEELPPQLLTSLNKVQSESSANYEEFEAALTRFVELYQSFSDLQREGGMFGEGEFTAEDLVKMAEDLKPVISRGLELDVSTNMTTYVMLSDGKVEEATHKARERIADHYNVIKEGVQTELDASYIRLIEKLAKEDPALQQLIK